MPIRVALLGELSPTLHGLLGELPTSFELQVLGSHVDRRSAELSLRTGTPDVALVSAHLQDGSGFELIASLEPADRPVALIFLSAREEDAVRAFELQATDFVPVPILPARLREALVRARQVVLHTALLRTADELQRLVGEVETISGLRDSTGPFVAPHVNDFAATDAAPGVAAIRGTEFGAQRWDSGDDSLVLTEDPVPDSAWRPAPKRVLVREGRRTCFVPLSDVDWFEADGNYIVVHSGVQAYRTRGTITAIEAVLDPRQFARIHRRMVVNMDRVREMSPLPGGDGLLTLGDGVILRLSRTYRARVR